MSEPSPPSDIGMTVGNNFKSSAIPSSSKNFVGKISQGALLPSSGRAEAQNLGTFDFIQGPQKQLVRQHDQAHQVFNHINRNDGNIKFNSTQMDDYFGDISPNSMSNISISRKDNGSMTFTHARCQLPSTIHNNHASCFQTTENIDDLNDRILQLRRQLRNTDRFNPYENQHLGISGSSHREDDLFPLNGTNCSQNDIFLVRGNSNSICENNIGQTEIMLEQKQPYPNFHNPYICSGIALNEGKKSASINSGGMNPMQSVGKTDNSFESDNYCEVSGTVGLRGGDINSTIPATNRYCNESFHIESAKSFSGRATTMHDIDEIGICWGFDESGRFCKTNQLESKMQSRNIGMTTSSDFVGMNRGESENTSNHVNYSHYDVGDCAGNHDISRIHGSKTFQNDIGTSRIFDSCANDPTTSSIAMASETGDDNCLYRLGRNHQVGNERIDRRTNFLNAINVKSSSETRTVLHPSTVAPSTTKQQNLCSTNVAATIADHVWRCRICCDPKLVFESFEEMREHHKVCTKSRKRVEERDEETLLSSTIGNVFGIGTNSSDMTGKIIFRDDNKMIPPSPLWGPEMLTWNQQAAQCPESVGSGHSRNPPPENNADFIINDLYPPRPPFAAGEQIINANFQSWLKEAKPSSSNLESRSKENPQKKPRTCEAGQTPQVVTSAPCSSEDFAPMANSMPLSLKDDSCWVTPLHCFVRKHFVEVFTAGEDDVKLPSKGKRRQTTKHQVGIRCPHCRDLTKNTKEHSSESNGAVIGSVYYPNSITHIYNATMNLLQRHLQKCPNMPKELLERYNLLKSDDARSAISKKYWIDSARSLGLVDTPDGIRYAPNLARVSTVILDTANSSSGEANVPSSEQEHAQHKPLPSNLEAFDHEAESYLVNESDAKRSTNYAYFIMRQMRRCDFSEADRLGKRKDFEAGFAGLACRHCFGGYGSGRFFPSSIKTLSDTSKTLNVLYAHLMRCRKCPMELKEMLTEHKKTHDSERQKMRFGSQKEFFSVVWKRLHGSLPPDNESIFNKK
ncbi:hypothetical protein ACHAXS_007080 [Conticribra weissflogii]